MYCLEDDPLDIPSQTTLNKMGLHLKNMKFTNRAYSG